MQENKQKQILIVEDELILSYAIKEMLNEYGYDFTLVANNKEDAKSIICSQELLLAILDINLSIGNEGISLAKECYKRNIPVIFLTSYTDSTTLNLALETTPEAYLVKPVNPTELYSAVNLIIQKSQKNNAEFTFKNGTEFIKLKTSEITHLKSDGIYVEIYTTEKKFLHRNSLANVLENLPTHLFAQTHRSYAVNTTFIDKVRSNCLIMGDYEIPISRTFKEAIKNKVI